MKKSLVVAVAFMLGLLIIQPVTAALPVEEYGLNPSGGSYEINADGQGGLWVSDFGATPGEIVRVDADTGNQTVYPISWKDLAITKYGSPSDARMVGGSIWWIDVIEGVIGRAAVGTGNFSLWSVGSLTTPEAPSLYSLAVGGPGLVWALDSENPWIFKLTVDAQDEGSVCMYTLSDTRIEPKPQTFDYYMAYSAGYLWIGNNFSNSLLRLDGVSGAYTEWNLPTGASLFALAIDENGGVWATDYNLPFIYKFDPTSDILTTYPLPQNIVPMMITFAGSRVVLSADGPASVAFLNPTKAASTTTELSFTVGQLTPTCDPNPVIRFEGTAAPTPITPPKANTVYPLYTISSGWDIYKAPTSITCGSRFPWGIANEEGNIWMVDNFCNQLIRFALPEEISPSYVYLPLILR